MFKHVINAIICKHDILRVNRLTTSSIHMVNINNVNVAVINFCVRTKMVVNATKLVPSEDQE